MVGRSGTPDSQMSTSSKGSAGTKSNGLETAQTAIKNLDRMIAGMRQRRADCGNQIQEDTAEIERITKEADEINRKINHIKSARAERVKRRDELQGILDHHMALMKAVSIAYLAHALGRSDSVSSVLFNIIGRLYLPQRIALSL
uniref:Uncharacterized protein n=1 Tax=Palpitomonas bilix TaxID=652834 RepID=A0A7S3DEH0_9EUKA|mmetsp:Transcript_34365/g.88864  ORF Transcript_34365/g.88864 Transcript_34365/m.88864 type:complete len:144 (+) Transcript_34365:134-565(+)